MQRFNGDIVDFKHLHSLSFKEERLMKNIHYLKALHWKILILAVFCTSLLATPASVWAVPYQVNVNVAAFSGTDAQIAFDFIDGGTPSNTVTISAFSTDGTLLGTLSTSGAVIGNLPGTVTLTDTDFFNEYLQDITLGSTISFLLESTTNAPSGSFPDAFSFLILNTSGLPLFDTGDPTGANALFILDIDGTAQGALSVYSASASVAAVPEPGTLLLLGSGLVSLFIWRRRPR